MNIHEHQAKDILKEFEAPVSKGVVIFYLDEISIEKVSPNYNKFFFNSYC